MDRAHVHWLEWTHTSDARSQHPLLFALVIFFSADEKSNFFQPLHILRSNYQISALDVVLSFIVHDLCCWCCRQRCKVILHRPKRFVDSIVSYLYWWRRGQWLLQSIFIFGSSQTHTKCFSFSRFTCSVNASFTSTLDMSETTTLRSYFICPNCQKWYKELSCLLRLHHTTLKLKLKHMANNCFILRTNFGSSIESFRRKSNSRLTFAREKIVRRKC